MTSMRVVRAHETDLRDEIEKPDANLQWSILSSAKEKNIAEVINQYCAYQQYVFFIGHGFVLMCFSMWAAFSSFQPREGKERMEVDVPLNFYFFLFFYICSLHSTVDSPLSTLHAILCSLSLLFTL